MDRGDYMSLKVDWAADTMRVTRVGPVLQSFCNHAADQTFALPPPVHALDCLLKMNPQEAPPYRFLMDIQYGGENIFVSLHLADDYASVVNVPHERLKKTMGGLLTPREIQVATLLFEGDTIRYIAATLHIAEGTVKRIIYNIYQKMNVSSQVELVREIYARLAQQAIA